MPKSIYTPEEARLAQNESKARYDKENARHISMKFNKKTMRTFLPSSTSKRVSSAILSA